MDISSYNRGTYVSLAKNGACNNQNYRILNNNSYNFYTNILQLIQEKVSGLNNS